MKKVGASRFVIFSFSVFILFSLSVKAQLSGTKSIPGDYASIESAIADLNLQGVGPGGVVFNIAAGHTETFTNSDAGIISATGTASNPIIFQKSGTGVNPKITAATGTGTTDGIIKITGGDYITFDGIDLSENPANTDATTQMEWGFALVKRNATAPVDGCRYITIKNCNITLNSSNTSSTGIYSGNHLANSTSTLILSDSLDTMSYCKFFSNNISNVYHGIRLVGSTVAAFYDQYNEIGVEGGNSITNFGGGSTSSYGMNLEYQNNLKVANNIVNGGGPSQTGAIYGIRTGTATNANFDVYNNTVSLYQGGTSLIYAIVNSTGGSGTNNTVNIYNNIVENCVYPTSSSNTVWLIYNLASVYNLNIYGNIVRNNTKAGGTGAMYCIYNNPTAATANVQIYRNEIYGNSGGASVHGINITSGINTLIHSNKIYNLTTNSSNTYYAAGITVSTGPINTYIYNNFISDLRAIISTQSDAIRGINIISTTTNSYIGVYYNSIYLNATGGGGNFGSAGIYHTNSSTSTTATLDMRNNIVINLSQASGTGKTAAFRRSAANVNLSNYSTLSNNNCFYAGTPGSSNVIFYDGTNFDQTIEDFKLRVAPRETFSFSENVPFVNITTLPYDLHVRTDLATQVESGGTPITSPVSVVNDFDNDIRNITTPDIGADEFNGISQDITPPSISYTVLSNTTSTSNRLLSNVVIIDQSGININTGLAPRIYYKRSSDDNNFIDNTSLTNGWKYTESSTGSSPFEFTIDYSLLYGGSGVQQGDTIQYFVIAQDMASTPNVSINSGIASIPPTSVNLSSSNFPITGDINFYRIFILLNGEVTIGTGGNYPSLTGDGGLFRTINENIMIGNVTAKITSNLIEPGTNPLNQWVEQGVGNYALTIQPSDSTLKLISGAYNGALIRIAGADKVTIDGRYNGTGNYLLFENSASASNSAVIALISEGSYVGVNDIVIRNCIIKAGSNSSPNIFGIYAGNTNLSTGSTGGAQMNNISLIGNIVRKSRIGIFARGTTSSLMSGLMITGNVVGSDDSSEYVSEYGIYVQSAAAPVISDNHIYNMIYEVSKWAIYFGSNVNNSIVSKNKIHTIKQPGTLGYNSVGIYFSSATGCFNNRIDNNMIYDLSTYGNTSMYLVGIRIAGGNDYKIYHNSVSITDTIWNTAASLPSSCLYLSAAVTNIDVRNNIFLNRRVGNDPKNYTIFSPNTTTFTNLNNNAYWNSGNVFGYFGADILTFNDWKTTLNTDSNSHYVDPQFTNTLDLHINSGLTPTKLESGGAFLTGINFDIDGDVRPGPVGSINGGATAPDIGADEFDGVPVPLPDTVNVNVMNNFFDPPHFTVQVGDFVKWTLVEGMHTTTSTTIPGSAASWNYTFSGPGDVFIYQVTVAGDYSYECLFHSGMVGTFTAIETNTFQLTVPVGNGWNMVSVPGQHPVDQNVLTWWPGKDPAANVFKFQGSYQPVTTVQPGF
ncbi:MAG: hypothetical protein D8M26_16775, partial [Ignavibacteriae bacterium]|nr:hypothetical protein [Ignavibacteriota bacterium]